MKRRNFLGGLAGILAAGAAPAIVHNPMKIVVPKRTIELLEWSFFSDPGLMDPHSKGQNGLFNVDNTTDSNKGPREYQRVYLNHLRETQFTEIFYPTVVITPDDLKRPWG